MSDRAVPNVFVDTNVFLYAFDTIEPKKAQQASEWIESLLAAGCGRTGLQVVREFYAQARRAERFGSTREQARHAAAALLEWDPIETDASALLRAWEIEDQTSISWWDALIVASAERADCGYLLTEDLNHGQRYGEVEAVNPFAKPPRELAALRRLQ